MFIEFVLCGPSMKPVLFLKYALLAYTLHPSQYQTQKIQGENIIKEMNQETSAMERDYKTQKEFKTP